MKAGIVIIGLLIAATLLSVGIMIKYATEIQVDERLRYKDDPARVVYQFTRQGVISLHQNSSLAISQRFPYIAAITTNYSFTWSFACFASVILVKWVVTSAHCRRPGATHRVLFYHDFIRNYTHTYPILFWKLHEDYNELSVLRKYDIAVAKINFDDDRQVLIRSSYIEESPAHEIVASIWKTVSTMEKRLFLTNDLEGFDMNIAPDSKCLEIYGFTLDTSMFCVDMSAHQDCFVNEFGPIYSMDRVVGIIAMTPKDCDIKFAVFTNVSYYTNWILQATKTTFYG